MLILLWLTGCSLLPAPAREIVPGGDARRGRALIDAYGCDACHTVPGVPGTKATVGPPLTGWPERAYIAGTLVNTPENLMRWIQAPEAIAPGTAMPNLDVSESEARDISAYLYTLR